MLNVGVVFSCCVLVLCFRVVCSCAWCCVLRLSVGVVCLVLCFRVVFTSCCFFKGCDEVLCFSVVFQCCV